MTQQHLQMSIHDRAIAGQALAQLLLSYRRLPNVIVLGLPRGGVPVAYEIAKALELRLDLALVRKLGVPGHKELAMGAIASGGVQVLNQDILRLYHIDQGVIDTVVTQERAELERRERTYRGTRPPPCLKGQVVILVDDGLATGATMRAAIAAVRQQSPARIVVAVPVSSTEAVTQLRVLIDELVCPFMLQWFFSIGECYRDFSQTPDEEVITLVQRAWARKQVPPD